MRLVVVEFNSSGGLIHYAYQLCTALADQGIEVTLITGTDYELHDFPHNFRVKNFLKLWSVFDPESMGAPLESPSVSVIRWQKIKRLFRRGIRALKLTREWFRLTACLIRLKPDVIQFGSIKFFFETFFLALLYHNNLILSQVCHEFEHRENRGRISQWHERMSAYTFRYFSAILFHANENKDRFLSLFQYPEKNTHVISHGNEQMFITAAAKLGEGENLRQRYGLQEKEPVILFIGLLSPSKGLSDLIDAFAIVRKHCRARLVIAGYPTKDISMSALHKQVVDHDLTEHVIFDTRYIPINSMKGLMELATLVAYPYHSSTQSGALQLAYAFGRPVIGTAVGGLPEVIVDGKSGFLIPPRNPAELAKKIIKIISTPGLAEQMGEYAHHLSETLYGWEPIALQIAGIYHHLTDNR